MKRGNVKERLGGLTGNAGEYLVVGELLKRGVVASPAPRNTPDLDVLVTSPDGGCSANIRVKTLSPSAESWVWNDKNAKKRGIGTVGELKAENIKIFSHIRDKGDFTVLVDLKDNESPPEFFVTPTKELNGEIVRRFLDWFRQEPKV